MEIKKIVNEILNLQIMLDEELKKLYSYSNDIQRGASRLDGKFNELNIMEDKKC